MIKEEPVGFVITVMTIICRELIQEAKSFYDCGGMGIPAK